MKLKAQQVFTATKLLGEIIAEKRPMPQKGSYRLVRLHKALLPEFAPLSDKYDALLVEHCPRVEGSNNQFNLTPQFVAAWGEIAGEDIEVTVEPVPLSQLDLGPTHPATIRADELIVLGDLIVDDEPVALPRAA